MPAPAASALQICRPWRERTAKLEPEIASRANAGERETARREPLGVTRSGERAGNRRRQEETRQPQRRGTERGNRQKRKEERYP